MSITVVGSPPYVESLSTATNGIDRSKMTYRDGRPLTATSSGPLPQTAYGSTHGQLGSLPAGALDAPPQTATPVPVTTWQGCYGDTWQDLIVPEVFAHPAKFARGLIHRIYRHLLEQGYVRQGDVVLDCFGGVALGALDAMTYGLRYVGVELEPRFVALGQQNLALWRQRYGFSGGTIVQGDSRRLREVLAGAQVQAVVGSPPYAESDQNYAHNWQRIDLSKAVHTRVGAQKDASYGTTPGQLGAMPPGCVVSSPPWEASLSATSGIDREQRQRVALAMGRPQSQVSPVDVPYPSQTTYGTSPAQLGNTAGDTFWAASAQIMQELSLLLPAGAVCAWVVKAYVSKKAIVPFPDQWRALCEAHGFRLVEEIHASLVEDHGTQEGLFGEAQRVTTEKKSFFRRLAEKKGSPRIDHETVLILRKEGSGGGVCCVSSPPFQDQQPSHADAAWHRARAQIGDNNSLGRMQSYGTTPGNLGNLPVGRP